MKIKKFFIALCASALFFNVVSAEKIDNEKKYISDIDGFPFIYVESLCSNSSTVVDLLKQYTDTTTGIMCLSYKNDSDQIIVTFPLKIKNKYIVFMFKIHQDTCLEFISQTSVKKNDIPFLYSENGIYKVTTYLE